MPGLRLGGDRLLAYLPHLAVAAVTALLTWAVTVRTFRPLSERQMRHRGFTRCPLCEGAGAINDITATHGTPRVHHE